MLQDWNSLLCESYMERVRCIQIMRKEEKDAMQTLQTTSHCFQHATRLELTDCELYMERRIEIIRKEKRDAMQTLQATAHCFENATSLRLELTNCESYMERCIQIIWKEKTDAMLTLQTACITLS